MDMMDCNGTSGGDGRSLPAYWREGIPCYNRRAEWHDYTSRCYYMVTVVRNKSWKSPFCIIRENGRDQRGCLRADLTLTATGKIIFSQLYDMERHFEEVWLWGNVVMPDHVHAIIFVQRKFELGLGAAVNYFKGSCTRRLREVDTQFALAGISLFSDGYHDRIVTRKGMLARLRNYVLENPVRYIIKRRKPDMFTSGHILECRGRRWRIYGNFLLLKEPDKAPLIVSSRYDEEERLSWMRRWQSVARNGGVLISPFYGEKEKALRNDFIEAGAAIIHLQAEGFPERFAPKGGYFRLCEERRLLIIGEEVYSMKKFKLSRQTALELNEFARWLSEAASDEWKIVKG